MPILPFYGSERPDLFALERAAMDRPGRVLEFLDDALPQGLVVDIGAGDGFTADALSGGRRTVVALEPDPGMVDSNRSLPWVRGDAEALPFAAATFDGAYATWAYFFSRGWDPSAGTAELHRVVRTGGPILIVDNLGGDEFTALTERDISADPAFWLARGFDCTPIETEFSFESLEEARKLLGFYFGERGRNGARLSLQYRVGAFTCVSRGRERPVSPS